MLPGAFPCVATQLHAQCTIGLHGNRTTYQGIIIGNATRVTWRKRVIAKFKGASLGRLATGVSSDLLVLLPSRGARKKSYLINQ